MADPGERTLTYRFLTWQAYSGALDRMHGVGCGQWRAARQPFLLGTEEFVPATANTCAVAHQAVVSTVAIDDMGKMLPFIKDWLEPFRASLSLMQLRKLQSIDGQLRRVLVDTHGGFLRIADFVAWHPVRESATREALYQ